MAPDGVQENVGDSVMGRIFLAGCFWRLDFQGDAGLDHDEFFGTETMCAAFFFKDERRLAQVLVGQVKGSPMAGYGEL